VDGPSGAGKTVFAGRLAAALAATPELAGGGAPPVVHTDDLLDGWADQVTFWPRLDEWVLAPLRAGRPGRYRRYDWLDRRFAPEWNPVAAAPVLILEGVTAARAAVRPELTLAVFVTAPSRLRLDRALARDGAALLPSLEEWRRGERAHFAADGTADHADLLVDGAPQASHDPTTQYVWLRPHQREHTGRTADHDDDSEGTPAGKGGLRSRS
jgi:uridine kinase